MPNSSAMKLAWLTTSLSPAIRDREQTRRQQLMDAVAENRRALELARARYAQGVADFLTVLDAQRTLLANELLLSDSTTTVSGNLVVLYKALGVGWEADVLVGALLGASLAQLGLAFS